MKGINTNKKDHEWPPQSGPHERATPIKRTTNSRPRATNDCMQAKVVFTSLNRYQYPKVALPKCVFQQMSIPKDGFTHKWSLISAYTGLASTRRWLYLKWFPRNGNTQKRFCPKVVFKKCEYPKLVLPKGGFSYRGPRKSQYPKVALPKGGFQEMSIPKGGFARVSQQTKYIIRGETYISLTLNARNRKNSQ